MRKKIYLAQAAFGKGPPSANLISSFNGMTDSAGQCGIWKTGTADYLRCAA